MRLLTYRLLLRESKRAPLPFGAIFIEPYDAIRILPSRSTAGSIAWGKNTNESG